MYTYKSFDSTNFPQHSWGLLVNPKLYESNFLYHILLDKERMYNLLSKSEIFQLKIALKQ